MALEVQMRKVEAKCIACNRMLTIDLDAPLCVCGNTEITRFYIQLSMDFSR